LITESFDSKDFGSLVPAEFSYDKCIKRNKNSFFYFPSTIMDIKIIDFMAGWNSTMINEGFQMKTGPVVDFMEKQYLLDTEFKNTVPLLWSCNFDSNNKIKFPVVADGKPQFLINSSCTRRLQIKSSNYILIKRFTSKEESRRIQCALLRKSDLAKYSMFSVENHINYITRLTGEMSFEEMYGLYVILNSSIADRYFRLFSGSTQVNAYEINSMPMPEYSDVVELGKTALSCYVLNERVCDIILFNKYL
jgi:adenine-specific DNA-methyltransferase